MGKDKEIIRRPISENITDECSDIIHNIYVSNEGPSRHELASWVEPMCDFSQFSIKCMCRYLLRLRCRKSYRSIIIIIDYIL